MVVYKEKQFLIFDFENGKNVKYDFATKNAIGIKGKVVKDLRGQLSGISLQEIIDSCEDQKYAKFLKFVQKQEEVKHDSYISNIGTILSRVPKYANFEQIFSAGIEEIITTNGGFKYTMSDIPKGLIKLCKDRKIKLSNDFLKYYNKNPNAYLLAYNLDFITLNDYDIYSILSYGGSNWIATDRRYVYYSYFNKLIEDFGYKAKPLLLYIDSIKTFEAIDDMNFIMRELLDYARMMSEISNKFDKYPRNFLTTHKIACRNYNRLKIQFQEDLFEKRIDKNLEFSYKDYTLIYPKTTQDIKDEAVQQNNCVSSYIKNVIDGNCHIMFMRRKDKLEDSLVTIEIRNNKIVQAKGKFNREVTPQEQLFINKWNDVFNREEENVA